MRILSLMFIGFALIATLVHAQAPAAAPAATPAVATTTASGQSAAEKSDGAAEPQGFTYNPDGRRDPFVSLTQRGSDSRSAAAPRGAGLAGLDASEVSLRGVLTSEGAFVGILRGIDQKNYIVRVGDKLHDGTIRTITKDSLVILQHVNDPLSLQKEREVRKLLRQTDEAK